MALDYEAAARNGMAKALGELVADRVKLVQPGWELEETRIQPLSKQALHDRIGIVIIFRDIGLALEPKK
jgi:hypothetical protein